MIFQDLWNWLGGEIAAFGVRWIAVVLIMLIFGGFWGKRYRDLKQEVADLKRGRSRSDMHSIHFAPQININAGQPNTDKPFIYDPNERTVWFGTEHGDMRVRFHDADTIMDDINKWLEETKQRRSVSADRIRRVLYRSTHSEYISVGEDSETQLNPIAENARRSGE